MDESRIKPDELLRQNGKEKKKYGHLKIFFGYAAGAGKTYAMLEAAHEARRRGSDVVVGYVEDHMRPQTDSLMNGLEILPPKEILWGETAVREFDLDGAIARSPGLLLVDELAHINGDGCRHLRRYQDIKELLNQGIDVYTTVNVQHIESLNDLMSSITGSLVKERVPDSVFDNAAEVELVDIEPKELIERLLEGKIYAQGKMEKSSGNYFTVQKLVALREIALRRCADRVNKIAELSAGESGRCLTDEHILVCLSTSPTNAKIIRTAARMAGAFKGRFTALFVETPDFSAMKHENKERLRQNMRLAEQLGAAIEIVYGEEIAFQISEFARLSGVSKLVLGRSSANRAMLFGPLPLTEKITQLSPNLDVYIIPDQSTPAYKAKRHTHQKLQLTAVDIGKSLLALAASTGIGHFFFILGFRESNIITVYILGVLVTAAVTSHRAYSLVSSIISVLLFNFFFTDPRFTLNAYDAGYIATFPIMFIAAFLTSSLTARIKMQAGQAAETAYRTKILFDTSQQLGSERDADGIRYVTCSQLTKLLHRDIVFYSVRDEGLADPMLFPIQTKNSSEELISDNERAVAAWVYHNNKRAGATTDTLGESKCLYLSVRVGADVFGVIGIAIEDMPLDAFENSIMLSILGECALALKNDEVSKERAAAELLAKNEQLRANLLRSISHDLRTPLTSISGNAGILISSEKSIDKEKRKKLYIDIYDDSLWLINLVENLLFVTRIEDGTMKLNMTAELLEEIITEALQHVDRRRKERNILVKQSENFILVKADARLIMQVIINLVDNAIKYTPPGSDIIIETMQKENQAVVTVSDNGPGITDSAKKLIFQMFYTDSNKAADSRRSLGLGLALCKSIIMAHGGTISITDNQPHGAVFTFILPTEEVKLHE